MRNTAFDLQAIRNLVFTYARLLDGGDLEGVAELFRGGRISTQQGIVQGYDAVLAMYQSSTRLYEDGTPRTRHLTTNLTIDLDGDLASCQSYFTVMQAVPPDFPLQAIAGGHYRDGFRFTGGEWHFHTRHIFLQLHGDLSRHLLFDPAQLDG